MTRVAILVLSGDPADAVDRIETLLPDATTTLVTKSALKGGSPRRALRMIRDLRCDVFAVYAAEGVTATPIEVMVLIAWVAGARELWFVGKGAQLDSRTTAWAPVRVVPRGALEALGGAFLVVLVRALSAFVSAIARRRRARGRQAAPARGGAPLRIAYLRSVGVPSETSVGGTASHTIGICRALGDLGHRVEVISRPPVPRFDHANVDVEQLEFAGTAFSIRPLVDIENHLRFAWASWQRLRDDPPDLLYQRHTRFDLSGAVLSLALRSPLILEHEGSERLLLAFDPTPLVGTLGVAEDAAHEAAGFILALSEEIERDLVEERGVAPQKIALTPSGVDLERFRPDQGGSEVRERLGIAADETVVGFSGTFAPWHGTGTLAEAIGKLDPEPAAHFLFIGDGDARADFQRQVEMHGKAHKATFTGLVAFEEMGPMMDACDILLCPTEMPPGQGEFFGSPTKLFEYMAAGKAVVATTIGQIPSIVADGESGLLVPPADSAALASAIKRLLSDPDVRRTLGANARAHIESNYSWRRNAERVVEQYEGLLRAT